MNVKNKKETYSEVMKQGEGLLSVSLRSLTRNQLWPEL